MELKEKILISAFIIAIIAFFVTSSMAQDKLTEYESSNMVNANTSIGASTISTQAMIIGIVSSLFIVIFGFVIYRYLP